MIKFRKSVECYVDRIWDACTDTAVGVPYNENASLEMELEYTWFGMWLYDNGVDIDKEIEKCNKTFIGFSNHREASFQVLSKYYNLWKNRK